MPTTVGTVLRSSFHHSTRFSRRPFAASRLRWAMLFHERQGRGNVRAGLEGEAQ